MNLEETKKRIIQIEWELFQAVQNTDGRTDCQNQPDTFYIMRKSQFDCWNEPLLNSYLEDLKNALHCGRNLIAEKYARMMEDTDPVRFQMLFPLLPALPLNASDIIGHIVQIQLVWMDEYVRLYPYIAAGNRIVHKEQAVSGETSFETYLRGELSTYSFQTLNLYLDYIRKLLSDGKNIVLLTMLRTVQQYGYHSLDTAEAELKRPASC